MYPNDEWRRLEGDERLAAVAGVGTIDGRHKVSSTTEVCARPLPFYRGVQLLRLNDAAWRPEALRVYYLRAHSGEKLRLDGRSDPIHDMNDKGALTLDEGNALEYLRFFCFFVHGDEGPFYVLMRRDDPNLPADFWTSTAEAPNGDPTPGELFRAPRLFGTDAEGKFRASAMVYFGTGVFLSDFLIGPTGTLAMVNDTPLTLVGVRLTLPIV